ncbi:MAG TPA: Atxe2 family lasso peptide isopeptidase [Allosphingosinicella sp.]|jgi:hypothetical protein|uniref:Atxe2 family lasso peptide isopeptidase n=1 Tax=Allosphingosinicella sp. TaxID=2823234 RepID=UPI002F2A9537
MPRLRAFGRPAQRWLAVALAGLTAQPAPAESPPLQLRQLVEVVDLSALSPSPDGRLVAFRTDRPSIGRNSYDLAWHLFDTDSGRRRIIAAAGEPILNDPGLLASEPPVWSPDSRWFYYRALRSGAVQVWRSAADGSGSQAVTADAGDVISIERAPDGRSLIYRTDPPRAEIERAELAEYDSGILVDQHVELGQNLFRGALIHGRRASQRLTGNWFSRGGVLWSRPPVERRLDFDTLATSPAPREQVAPPAAAGAAPVATGTSGNGDVASALWDGSEGSLTVVRAGAGGARITCAAPECQIDRTAWLAWRPGRDQIVFATSDRGFAYTLHLWDLPTRRVRTIARMNGMLSGGRQEYAPCAFSPAAAICVLAEAHSPPRLEEVNLETGASRPLFDPNLPMRGRRWPWTERLNWRSADGREFTGMLFLPKAMPGRPLPLFINYYRCEGFIRGGLGDEWPFALLAMSGIASVCVNATRISGPQHALDTYRAALGGIETLVDLLETRGLIDRRRVGMGGLSFGSEVTMWAVMHSDLISAASIASPQFEPSNYWFNAVRGRGHDRLLREVWGLGSPEETPERWRLLSPALNVDRIRAPLLLQLPEQESRYAIELYARLTNSTTPTELYVFPDEPHIKVQPRHRLAVYSRNLDWFRFWLQGYVDPDPAKARQYRRWRDLEARFRAAGQLRHERSQSSSDTRSNIRK